MLKYIGNGTFLTGIPARDLTDEEVRLYGGVVALAKTGLYERVEEKPVKASGTRKNDNPADTRQNKKQNGESN